MDATFQVPSRTLLWPIYLSENELTCNQPDCPDRDMFGQLSRRHTVLDILQAIHTHATTVPHVRDQQVCVNASLPECKELPHPHPVTP